LCADAVQLCDLAEQLRAKETHPIPAVGTIPPRTVSPPPVPPEARGVGTVSVEFGAQAGKLGISFEAPSESDLPRIKAIAPDGAAAEFSELKVGLELASIQGRPVVGMKMKDCMTAIRTSGRPITLGFNQSAQTLFNAVSTDRDGDYDSDDSGDSSALPGAPQPAPVSATTSRVAVEFSGAGKLGMSFGSDTDDAPPVKVTRVTSGALAAADGRIRPGMSIVRIAGADCTSWSIQQVISAIKGAPRPLTLEFLLLEDDLPALTLPSDIDASTQAKLLKAAERDDDVYSPSGGARGGGLKVLAKAGGEPPPLGEYKLLANCKCYTGKELDAAACDFSLDKDEIFHVQEIAVVEDGVIRLRSADG
jgi:hypothetical protein